MTETVHATCVALGGRGILLRGAPGAGKTGLALRLITEAGAALVADDGVALSADEGGVWAHAPAPLPDGAEARGVGFVRPPRGEGAPLGLVVEVTPGAATRLPDPDHTEVLGHTLPRAVIDPGDPAAASKLALALDPHARTAPAAGGRETGVATPRPVVVVTGMSGAGRSTFLHALEDSGHEIVDNLPLGFLGALARDPSESRPLAVGVDIRTLTYAAAPLVEAVDALRADPALAVTLVFLDCDEAELQRRYTETRRRHPLAQERPLRDGLAAERRLVAPVREHADLVIDTSTLAVGDLRRLATAHLGRSRGPGLVTFLTSFGYSKGLPREADWVIDLRFLGNPQTDPGLRPLTGRDSRVAAYVRNDPTYPALRAGLGAMLRRLLPRYEAEGKSYFTLALGCTGGRHRSVAVVEDIAKLLRALGRDPVVSHRDAPRPETDGGSG